MLAKPQPMISVKLPKPAPTPPTAPGPPPARAASRPADSPTPACARTDRRGQSPWRSRESLASRPAPSGEYWSAGPHCSPAPEH